MTYDKRTPSTIIVESLVNHIPGIALALVVRDFIFDAA